MSGRSTKVFQFAAFILSKHGLLQTSAPVKQRWQGRSPLNPVRQFTRGMVTVGVGGTFLTLLLTTGSLAQSTNGNPNSSKLGQVTEGLERPTLKSGSKGTEVSELQATLKLLGFYGGEVDGVFGQSTATAVSQFQQAAGLPADGVAGPATWNRLFPPTSIAAALPPAAPIPRPPTRPATPSTPPISSTKPPTISTGQSQPGGTTPPATVAPKPPQSANGTNPTTMEVAAFPVLKLGMRGPAVAGLQNRLRAIGVFKGSADGVFGTGTQDAVKAAQRKFNLYPDGVVGPATWTQLLQ
jgi:peptidoglycan hydrolase-like protein with peptidoglycan-binding domain